MFGVRGLICLALMVASLFINTQAKGCKPCLLPTVNDRVCSKDGKTYPSKCYMKVKGCVLGIELKVAHKGSCIGQRRNPPRRRPPHTTTVAPTDPPTTMAMPTTTRPRRRPSHLASQGRQPSVAGAQTEKTRDEGPGKTGWRYLQFTTDNIGLRPTRVQSGPKICAKICKPCQLPSGTDHVCGIDGITYPSKCYMKVRGCVLGIHVAVSHKGKCQRKPPPHTPTTTTMPPTTILTPTTTLRPTTTRQRNCGECPRPYASEAVCGSDSRTHPSVCWLDKLACVTNTDIQPVHMGKCVFRTSTEVVAVPDVPEVEPEEPEHRPEKAKSKRKGSKYSSCTICIASDYGPDDIACGSDGHNYPSPCYIEMNACVLNSKLTVAHIGECTQKRKKQTFTVVIPERAVKSTTPKPPPIFEPEEEETGSGNLELCGDCPSAAYDDIVCGSDGKSYPSTCYLQQITCLRNIDISIVFNGECPVEARGTNNGNEPCTPCSMPSSWDQVCGTDGQSYPSECILNLKVCIKNIDIRVKHEGECIKNKSKVNMFPEPDSRQSYVPPAVTTQRPTRRPIVMCPTCPAPIPSDKVCGNDGVTYSSRCVLHRRACTRQIRTRLDHEGPCGTKKKEVNSGYLRCTKCPPPQPNDMVCGSDGMTYPSECFLEIKACIKRNSLRTSHTGKCDPRKPNPVITRPIARRPKPKTTPAPVRTTEAPSSRWGDNCSFECPITFNPVCGTDNLNYPSPCILESFACHLYNPSLQVRHRGMCIRG